MLTDIRLSRDGRSGNLPSPLRRRSRRNPALRSRRGVAMFALCAAVTAALWGTAATATDRIRIAAQKTGTLAWELEIIRAHGIAKQADLDLQVIELASTEAGKIALRSGSVDVIVSDWLWVARERSLGDHLVFYPYSSTLGAVMTPGNSAIADLADLKGKKLAVAGGPLDKSWLLLQAVARRGGLDLNTQASIVYGAPPLLSAEGVAARARRDPDLLEFLRRTRSAEDSSAPSTWRRSKSVSAPKVRSP